MSDGLRAALERCALADRSILPRILATGPDLLDLLHRLSTNAVKDLEPGEGRATVLTTPKGRIAHRLAVHRLPDAGVLLVGGTGGAGAVLEHFRRFTFAEQLGLSDVTDSWAHFLPVLATFPLSGFSSSVITHSTARFHKTSVGSPNSGI